MANSVQFSVDDTSPTIAYSPFPDTVSVPNLAAGWNPYFLGSGFATSIGQIGVGQTQHITSRNGASLTILCHGTSIQLFGNTTSNATFSLTLDGASIQSNQSDSTPNLLASLDGLSDRGHTITLTVITPEVQDPFDSSLLVFDKAVISSPPPVNSSDLVFTERVLDDNDITFLGHWSFLPSTGQPPFHESQTESDSAHATFSGTSILIFGTTSPSAGNYSVTLDGNPSPIFSARSSFTNTNTLLFFASGLDANSSHHISVRNEGGGSLQLKSGGFDVFSSGEPASLPPSNGSPNNNTNNGNPTQPFPPASPPSSINEKFAKGTIAALVLAGFLAFIFFTAVLFYFLIWRPRRQRRQRREREFGDYATPQSRFQNYRKSRVQNPREPVYAHEKEQEATTNNTGVAIGGAGVVLDIGRATDQPDNAINVAPDVNAVTTTGENDSLAGNRGHRDSNRSGYARWKRDIHTLSGLTTIGLKFRHSDPPGGAQEEKSPRTDHGHGDFDVERAATGGAGVGGNGFIYGRYDPEVDGGIGVRSMSSRSSSRSFRRFGKKQSSNNPSGNGKGKGKLGRIRSSGFSFRFSLQSRPTESAISPETYEPQSDFHHNEDGESLSGFTSLSYASNPNLAAYLNVQPPSYAASVSQNTNSNSNGTSSPPSIPRSPQSQSRHPSVPPSPQDPQGPGTQNEPPVVVPSPDQQQPQPQPQPQPQTQPQPQPQSQQQRRSSAARTRSADEMHTSGMHILGIGGGLAGIGGPISMRTAIRGLSPRISKVRSMRRGKGKERESRQEQQLESGEQREEGPEAEKEEREPHVAEDSPSNRSRSDIASVGHHQQTSGSTSEGVPPLLPPPVVITSATGPGPGPRTGSPVRALPPIPVPAPVPSSSQPQPQPQQPSQQKVTQAKPSGARTKGLQQKQVTIRDSVAPSGSGSFLAVRETSPFRIEFENNTVGGPGVAPPSSSSSSSSPPERRFKGRSSTGDAAGLGSPGAVQSFAEAAAIAAIPTGTGAGANGGGILVEGPSDSGAAGAGAGGEGDGEGVRRLSTASRVHFEDDPTSTSASFSFTTPAEEPTVASEKEKETKGKEKEKAKERKKQREKEAKSRFRLTLPSARSPTSPTGASETMPGTAGTGLPSSGSGHDRGQPSEFGTTSFLDFSSQTPSLHSPHTPEASGLERAPSSAAADIGHGRIWSMQLPGRDIIPAVPPTPSTGLKSEWSNTTMQSTPTDSSSSANSGNGSPKRESVGAVTSEGSPRSNIFPFPLSIPPSPYLPEGFPGVEPSPSLLSPTASLPVPSAQQKTEYGKHLHIPGARPPAQPSSGQSRDQPREDHPHGDNDPLDSPTDSFPYSISEVHFRTSAGSESETDPEQGHVQHAHQQSFAHPPLPSSPLTPQRFNPQQDQSQPQTQPQSTPSSIVQRVFGGGSGSGTPRTPRSGFLKPSSS